MCCLELVHINRKIRLTVHAMMSLMFRVETLKVSIPLYCGLISTLAWFRLEFEDRLLLAA